MQKRYKEAWRTRSVPTVVTQEPREATSAGTVKKKKNKQGGHFLKLSTVWACVLLLSINIKAKAKGVSPSHLQMLSLFWKILAHMNTLSAAPGPWAHYIKQSQTKEKLEITGGQKSVFQERSSYSKHSSNASLCDLPILPNTPQWGSNHQKKRIWKVCICFSWAFKSAEKVVCVKPKTCDSTQGMSVLPDLPTWSQRGYIPVSLPGCCGCWCDEPQLMATVPSSQKHTPAFPGAGEITPLCLTEMWGPTQLSSMEPHFCLHPTQMLSQALEAIFSPTWAFACKAPLLPPTRTRAGPITFHEVLSNPFQSKDCSPTHSCNRVGHLRPITLKTASRDVRSWKCIRPHVCIMSHLVAKNINAEEPYKHDKVLYDYRISLR